MNQEIVIITGANSGIGLAATKKFASEGYTVIMACRNLEKSKQIQQEVIIETSNQQVDLLELDISSFASIHAFSKAFREKYTKLDSLIHNAGYFNHGEKAIKYSPEGIELTFATNVVGPYLLSYLLKDRLVESVHASILNACSTNIRHYFEPKRKIDFGLIKKSTFSNQKFSSYKLYGDSKMALLMVTFKMAEAFKQDGIRVNAIQIPAIKLSKGTINKFKSIWRILARFQNIFSASQASMGDTYFHICTDLEFKDVTGQLINDQREIVQKSFYNESTWQSIKQFKDKGVYPKYADIQENRDLIWEICKDLTTY